MMMEILTSVVWPLKVFLGLGYMNLALFSYPFLDTEINPNTNPNPIPNSNEKPPKL